MTKRACARSWEIEAARDGRLSGDAALQLEGHTRSCATCGEHARYVADLAVRLAALPVPEVDDVALRRLRGSILERADAELAGRKGSDAQPRWRLTYVAIPLAVTICLFAAWRVIGHGSSSLGPSRSLTVVSTTDEGGARWAQRSDADVERIDLQDGTLRLRVQRQSGGKRVIVRVPDGEIEDVGTTFHVVVQQGHTQRVAVDEGRVTVRLANAPPITLSSGQSWERAPQESVVAVRPDAPVTVTSTSASGRSQDAPSARSASRAATAPSSAASDDEDAAYIEAIRLARGGRTAEARVAARDYLRRFPNGFRREEAGELAK